jgi:hypothetical protein
LTPDFDAFYKGLETKMQTIGKLSSRMHRTLVLGQFIPQMPPIYDLNLLAMYRDLDESTQLALCEAMEIPVDRTKEICVQILERTPINVIT